MANQGELVIDEYTVKISASKIAIDGQLQLDEDVTIMIDGSVVKREDFTNNNGTVERCYVVRGIIGEVVDKSGKRIVGEKVEGC